MKLKEKVIEFPSYMRDKLDSFVKTHNLDIKYEAGKIITLTKSNVNVIVPHIITFISEPKILKLLYYGNYDENINRFYTLDLTEEISYTRLKDIIKDLR
ncbi:MAG: hypothetical protein PHF30_03270 [Bacilli bacterium]|nr:hypothetical protein [Bacilli bacterium]